MTDQDSIIAVQDRAHELAVLGRHTEAQKLYAAAERIRVLGEEVEAWRKRNAILTPREYERALADVVKFVAATDAARRGA